MSEKKKPPPGATLIARLREQRLAREAQLNEKKTQQAEAAAPEKSKDSAKAAPQTVEATEITVTTIEASSPSVPAIQVRHSSHVDLIHREINIEDLRPTTDDYDQLTEEIRLAGRFAAVGLIAQGLRLYRLKDAEIYKNHYTTFEDYCRKEHSMSATYAYRLIRMSEMAERLAERGIGATAQAAKDMLDPFEVLLGLGHRHLMALLPLEIEVTEELLTRGIPLEENGASGGERLPLNKATEKQIRAALRALVPAAQSSTAVRVIEKKPLASEKQLIPAVSKLVEMMEDWAAWLGSDPKELKAARISRGPLLTKLAKRFRAASTRIADALERESD